VSDIKDVDDYSKYIGEATLDDSYLKAPFFKPEGYPAGVYRVGPIARLNVAERCGTQLADVELREYRERVGRMPQSAFYNHYARLIEIVWCLERLQVLLDDPTIVSKTVRAHASVNAFAGAGIIEAPRGLLIHHYRVNEDGAMTWANLIVATGHNSLALNQGVRQVATRFIKKGVINDGILNRVCAVVRAYDPCLSCSTHADGMPFLRIDVRYADGSIARSLSTY
jgi:NAD-reducing hydrogenase large subunit